MKTSEDWAIELSEAAKELRLAAGIVCERYTKTAGEVIFEEMERLQKAVNKYKEIQANGILAKIKEAWTPEKSNNP